MGFSSSAPSVPSSLKTVALLIVAVVGSGDGDGLGSFIGGGMLASAPLHSKQFHSHFANNLAFA